MFFYFFLLEKMNILMMMTQDLICMKSVKKILLELPNNWLIHMDSLIGLWIKKKHVIYFK
jgi:hypothetical protein